MDHPLTPLDRGDQCCRWYYGHRKSVLAVGSAMAMCLLFVGVVLMARFADHTPGWTLLIAAACISVAFFTAYLITSLVRCLCPRYVGEQSSSDDALDGDPKTSTPVDDDKPVQSVFLSDRPEDAADDFEL